MEGGKSVIEQLRWKSRGPNDQRVLLRETVLLFDKFEAESILQINMGRSRSQLDPRDMKAAYVVSDDNGYYDRCAYFVLTKIKQRFDQPEYYSSVGPG